ncbi:hypothetical protein HanRHA438_Chr13g0582891 [Helianthus annuus]|nr:hypothetical protein HanRHA438_Chr13g0582891 [Helianthus annuus]
MVLARFRASVFDEKYIFGLLVIRRVHRTTFVSGEKLKFGTLSGSVQHGQQVKRGQNWSRGSFGSFLLPRFSFGFSQTWSTRVKRGQTWSNLVKAGQTQSTAGQRSQLSQHEAR